jgi:hypothetical protein
MSDMKSVVELTPIEGTNLHELRMLTPDEFNALVNVHEEDAKFEDAHGADMETYNRALADGNFRCPGCGSEVKHAEGYFLPTGPMGWGVYDNTCVPIEAIRYRAKENS